MSNVNMVIIPPNEVSKHLFLVNKLKKRGIASVILYKKHLAIAGGDVNTGKESYFRKQLKARVDIL